MIPLVMLDVEPTTRLILLAVGIIILGVIALALILGATN